MASNFNNTTPAAPTDNTNVNFQTDGSGNDSAYVPTSAQELKSVNVDLTAQTANVSATTIASPAVSGIYRLSVYEMLTNVGSVTSTLPSVVITWTDADNTTLQTVTLVPASASGNTLTTMVEGDVIMNVSGTTNIQYATSGYAANAATTMQYALHLRLEAL